MEWSIILVNAAGALITGASALTSLKVRRVADDYLLDWDDSTFKAAGWGHSTTALTEVSAANVPGLYRHVVSEAAWADGDYQGIVRYVPVAGTPVNGDMLASVRDGKEIVVRIGDVVEALPSAIAALPTDSDVQAAAAAALTAYDPPTAAELTAAVAPLATSSALATVDGIVDDILLDTAAMDARLPSDPADESAVEAAITAATSPLATSVAVAALPTDSDVQAAATAALVAYDPPTAAELASAVSPLATSASIAALNNLSAAQAQSAAAAALVAYDPPTKAELDAAVAPLATSAALATVDAIVDDILLDTAALDARVPADPADESALEAAITAATSPLATATAVADLPTDADVQAAAAAALGSYDAATGADISALNNLSSAQAQSAAAAAITAAGLATATALGVTDGKVDAVKAQTDKLAFTGTDVKATLDGESVAVASVATNAIDAASIKSDAVVEIAVGVDSALSTAHGFGAWGGGTSLTVQDVRDAMKLAPTAGVPATGSVDAHLDVIVTNSDAKVSDVRADVAALHDVSSAQVQAATTAAITTAALATASALATTDARVVSVQAQTDKLAFAGSDVLATLDGEAVAVASMAAGVVTAAAVAEDAAAKVAAETVAELGTVHGTGAWDATALDADMADHAAAGTVGEAIYVAKQMQVGRLRSVGYEMQVYAEDGVTVLREYNLYDKDGNLTTADDAIAERRPK